MIESGTAQRQRLTIETGKVRRGVIFKGGIKRGNSYKVLLDEYGLSTAGRPRRERMRQQPGSRRQTESPSERIEPESPKGIR